MDARYYACKKCRIDEGIFRKIRREVTTISRLLHTNIVRYYSAWLEEDEEGEGFEDASEFSGPGSSSSDSEEDGLFVRSTRDLSSGLIFQRGSDDDDDDDDDDGEKEDSPFGSLGSSSSIPPDDHGRKRRRTLFILMEYCDGTLRELIDKGGLKEASMGDILSLFRQLIEALSFVHAKGVIHRDIKPSNVLLRDGDVRLGDFGLAVGRRRGCFQRARHACAQLLLFIRRIRSRKRNHLSPLELVLACIAQTSSYKVGNSESRKKVVLRLSRGHLQCRDRSL